MEKDLHVSFVFAGVSGFSFGEATITMTTDEEKELTITPEDIEGIRKDLENDHGATIAILSWQWFDWWKGGILPPF